MKLVALMAWYDERPDWLHDSVTSLALAGVDRLVAVDGAYRLFPCGTPRSPLDNYDAILDAAKGIGIAVDFYGPDKPWSTEMAKRTAMFQQGERHTTDNDWYFVNDADTVVEQAEGTRRLLERTHKDVAATSFREPGKDGSERHFPIPTLFRAIRGLHVVRNHYTYVTPDNRRLWGSGRTEPKLDLTEVFQVEHRTHLRDTPRRQASHAYYKTRDRLAIERGTCERCLSPAVTELPAQWETDGEGKLVSAWVSVCALCLPNVKEENRRTLESYGLNPDRVRVTFGAAA